MTKYFIPVMLCLYSLASSAQVSSDYLLKMANTAGIKRPVPLAFAARIVKRPITMDSVSLVHFHRMYAHTLIAGTSLWVGGTLLVLAHILIPSVDSHYNSPLVSTLATVGVVAWGAGAVVLPIGGWEKHRYNKSLRIELAKRGM
jgi:hypothetical protein